MTSSSKSPCAVARDQPRSLPTARLRDPFSMLGPARHRIGPHRPRLPARRAGASRWSRAATAIASARCCPASRHGLFVGRVESRDGPYRLRISLARRGAGDRGSLYASTVAAERDRPASCSTKAGCSNSAFTLGANADDDRRRRRACASPSGRRTRARVSVVGDFNTWDGAPPPDAAALSVRRVGTVRAAARTRAHSTNTQSSAPTATGCR